MSFISKCPYCKNAFEAEEAWIGQIAACPSCGKKIIIQRDGNNDVPTRSEARFVFKCPYCGHPHQGIEAEIGQVTSCANCGKPIIIQSDDKTAGQKNTTKTSNPVADGVVRGQYVFHQNHTTNNGGNRGDGGFCPLSQQHRKFGWLVLSAFFVGLLVLAIVWNHICEETDGLGGPLSYKLKKQADAGNVESQYELGMKGNGAKKIKYLQMAAKQGYAKAQYELGCAYELSGRGVKQNLHEAIQWYRKAAEQGHAMAQYRLGLCYALPDRGVEVNRREAIIWLRKAAEQQPLDRDFDILFCQKELGFCYALEQNLVEAVKWFRKSAEQGDPVAQYEMGYFYENGMGIEKNLVKAIDWYQKAAKQGQELAKEALKRLER